MNAADFSKITRSIIYVDDAVYLGLMFLIPILFVLLLLKGKEFMNDFAEVSMRLVRLACLVFFAIVIANISFARYNNNEAERDFIISFINGPHWYQVVIPFINYGVLPLLLFIPAFKRNFNVAFGIALFWIISIQWLNYQANIFNNRPGFEQNMNWSEYGTKISMFLGIYVLYLVIYLNRKQKV